jgi:formate hydrogenlyase subunit 3/multisubunit Na+/H+ antiporter MnhD subunit
MGVKLFEIFNYLALVFIAVVPFSGIKRLARIGVLAISIQVLISFLLVFWIFSHGATTFHYPGSVITGALNFKADYLSAWFIAVISFTFLTGTFFGVKYLEKYKEDDTKLKIHAISYVLVYTALINLCVIQNALLFLVAWEVMALGAFMLIIFEWEKKETLKAGINFLIQSHICILLLTIGFIWVKVKAGSFDFSAIVSYTANRPALGIGLFMVFFTGFAIKAGFVPFHTWLPLAHPAAPAHISGVMSGVIIKIGIFGILRMVTLIKTDYTPIGYFVLAVSVITGVYGVMLAIVQHNLKRLLAYHSIENIGIIGMGIGVGCLGIGMENNTLFLLGFGGALLHTLNHSLFKSLLFFAAGNVYQAFHTMNIESLGGMIKKLPHTGYLFLIASLAICGLPPFNGFISEFLIYKGFFNGLETNHFLFTLAMLFSILGLVLIGGLALICFTKAFGVVFLGNNRSNLKIEHVETPLNIVPLYVIALAILIIGIMPFLFSDALLQVTSLFSRNNLFDTINGINSTFQSLTVIGVVSMGFIFIILAILYLGKKISKNKPLGECETWGCGYTGSMPKAQYTASSFIRTYRKLAEPLLFVKKEKKLSNTLYPSEISQSTHPYDKAEFWLIDKPIYRYKQLLNRFVFLQNGNIQYYILYGFVFVTLVFVLPMIISRIIHFINFLNQL